jgi:hypothetical protein
MKIKNLIGGIAAKGVIGKVLKSGSPLSEAAPNRRGKIAIAVGAIAAALGYVASYL